MPTVKVRYLQTRRNADGSLRFYWRRPGFKVEPLPQDEGPRLRRVADLNDWADKVRQDGRRTPRTAAPTAAAPKTVQPGSIAALIRDYQQTTRFQNLADSSQATYKRYFRRMEDAWGHLMVADLTRKAAIAWIDGHSRGMRENAYACLSVLLQHALDVEDIDRNVLAGFQLRLKKHRRRQLVTPDDFRALTTAAHGRADGECLSLALLTMLYTGQRVNDVRQLTVGDYQGGWISLTQEKTGAKVALPAHTRLAGALDRHLADRQRAAVRLAPTAPLLVRADGTAWTYFTLGEEWRATRKAAGLEDLQLRDFRRTAVTLLAEAGCEVPEIAAVTGHTVASANKIIETYFVRTRRAAEGAIRKLEGQAKLGEY